MDGQYPTGGSLELARLIDGYGEILLPELNERYGIDIRDIVRESPPFSPRYVLAHIRHLPIESAFIAEKRGGQHFRGWDESMYMRAAQINTQKITNWLFILANSDPAKRKPKPPEMWPIPDEIPKPKDKPGSFGFIARDLVARAKKRKDGAV